MGSEQSARQLELILEGVREGESRWSILKKANVSKARLRNILEENNITWQLNDPTRPHRSGKFVAIDDSNQDTVELVKEHQKNLAIRINRQNKARVDRFRGKEVPKEPPVQVAEAKDSGSSPQSETVETLPETRSTPSPDLTPTPIPEEDHMAEIGPVDLERLKSSIKETNTKLEHQLEDVTRDAAKAEDVEKISAKVDTALESLGGQLASVQKMVEGFVTATQNGSKELGELKGRLSGVPDEEKLKAIVSECVDGQCERLAAVVQPPKEDSPEEIERKKHGHMSASEALDCPTCRPKFWDAVADMKNLGEQIGSLSPEQQEKLKKNLRGAGVSIF